VLTAKDVKRVEREQEDADEELRERLADISETNTDITRRLDYTYYALLEKVGNLVATIQSFQSLSTQSRHLIENFATETGKLDQDIKRRANVFRSGFNDREKRVADLQARSKEASAKTQDLGRRLENARVIVENWEKCENDKARKWGRVCVTAGWMFISLFVLLVVMVVARGWWLPGDPVRAGLKIPRGGSNNESLALGKEQLRRIEVPPEVREVLEGIEQRRANKPLWPGSSENIVEEVGEGKDDERLRRLDEL